MDAKDVLDLQVGVADLRIATRAFDEPWAPWASSEPCTSKITSRPAGPTILGGGLSAFGRAGSIAG
jgi:hypothetical protein